jgi:serine/threonine-protein kinase
MANPEDVAIGVGSGDVIGGKYRVERILGRGGMGVVVAAHHIQLDERVALKFLLPHALQNPEAASRFLREARTAVKIKSEHVARVSDVGQLDDGSPYMVMEYLEGDDLSAWLEQRGPMAVETAVDFVLQACEAIAEAHALGIVHRDLKPANLFCTTRADGLSSIKVLDFGISKIMGPGAELPGLTTTTAIVGSPTYMSPEQLQSSKGVDTRTDIWSLGVILFELLTGRVPFEAEAVTELVIKIATSPAPPVRAFRQGVPAALERTIATCLQADREGRFSSVRELAVALEDFGSGKARASVERILGTLKTAGISGVTLSPSRRKGHALWIGAAVVFAVFGVVGILAVKRSSPSVAPAVVPATAASPPAPSSSAPSIEEGAASAAVVAPSAIAATEGPSAAASSESAARPQPSLRPSARSARPARPPPKPAADCDPPYTLDDQGRKHFKAECYR